MHPLPPSVMHGPWESACMRAVSLPPVAQGQAACYCQHDPWLAEILGITCDMMLQFKLICRLWLFFHPWGRAGHDARWA